MSAHERERLSAWLDGELAPAERAEVEAHLAACPECAAVLAEMGALDEAARELPVEAPSGYFETFPERVRARIETESPARARPDATPPRWRMPVWAWAAAAVLLLAVVTPLTLDRLDRDGAPARLDAVARAPKDAALSPALVTPEAPKPSEAVAPLARAERDEMVPADQDRASGVRTKQEEGPGRRLDDQAVEPPSAFAAPPAPEPPAPVESRSRERRAETPTLAVSAPAVAEGKALGEALEQEEASPAEPEPRRRQAVMQDVATPEAATEAIPMAANAPAKGRMAAPQAAEVQGGLSVEKKNVPEDTLAYARLDRGAPEDATTWREHREEWRSFAIAHPQSRHVDEARVRVIEAGIEAWRAGGDPEDLAGARADADEYLARDDAQQKDRVRRGLNTAPESPR